MNLGKALSRYFPAPTLLIPRTVGIDVTDGSVKWVALSSDARGLRVRRFGDQALQPGIVMGGIVRDIPRLASVLVDVRKKLGTITHVHAALPEEGAYVFSMHVPAGSRDEEIAHMVEFELDGRVPIPVSDAVYDYDTIGKTPEGDIELGVVAFSRELAEGYASAFSNAGFSLLSLEIEARSVGRAVTESQEEKAVTLLVDTGKQRTGFAILKNGIPIFTSTVEVGGGDMTRIVMDGLHLSEKEALLFKNEHGLLASDATALPVRKQLESVADAIAQEVSRHYRFWDTRRNEHGERVTPVGQIYLVGGNGNLRGLTEFIASRVHAPTERPNIWRNVASFDDYIPPIDRRTSLQYVTAVGLALRGEKYAHV